MKKVFTDDSLNEQFNAKGYVILKDKLNIDFDAAYTFFNSLESKVNNTFYSAIWSSNPEYRKIIDVKIKEILSGICTDYLKDYQPFFSDLLVKKPSVFEKLNWHQDWTFVDENKYASVFIWCPLQDVTKKNGCMMILPESHLFFNAKRGSNISSGLDYKRLHQLEKKYAEYLTINKGDVLIFNQSLLHASLPNRTLKNRLSVGLYCVPVGGNVYHYHYDFKEKKYLQYEIDHDFILHFSDAQNFKKNIETHKMPKPEGKVINELTELNKPFGSDIYTAYEDYLINKKVTV